MSQLLSVLLVAFFVAFAHPAFAREFRIVTLLSSPLAYEEKGEVVGLATEVVREALRRMGHTATISIVPWKRGVHMVRFGEADAIFYAVRNKEREAWFHYPDEPLLVEATVPVRLARASVRVSPERLEYSMYRLGVGRGYYYGPKLKKFLDQAWFARVEEATTIESNFAKLLKGRIDVFLADLTLARYYIEQNAAGDQVAIVGDEDGKPVVLDSSDAFLAFSRKTTSPEVARNFSRVLSQMKQDGTYRRIFGVYAP